MPLISRRSSDQNTAVRIERSRIPCCAGTREHLHSIAMTLYRYAHRCGQHKLRHGFLGTDQGMVEFTMANENAILDSVLASISARLDSIERALIQAHSTRQSDRAWLTTSDLAIVLGRSPYTVRLWCNR